MAIGIHLKHWQRLAAGLIVLAGQPALALDLQVDSLLDEIDASIDGQCVSIPSGACTLRAAIQEANAAGGPHTVTIPAGTLSLTRSGVDDLAATGDLDILSEVAINGAGTNIQAAFRIFDVRQGGRLSISNLNLAGFKEPDAGIDQGGTANLRIDSADGLASASASNVEFRVVSNDPILNPAEFSIFVGNGSLNLDAINLVHSAANFGIGSGFRPEDSAAISISNSTFSVVQNQVGAIIRHFGTGKATEISILGSSFDGQSDSASSAITAVFGLGLPPSSGSLSIRDSSFMHFRSAANTPTAVQTNCTNQGTCSAEILRSLFADNDRDLSVFGSEGTYNVRVEQSLFRDSDEGIAMEAFSVFYRANLFLTNSTLSGHAGTALVLGDRSLGYLRNVTITGANIALQNQLAYDAFVDNSVLANSITSDCVGDFRGSYNLVENSSCVQVGGDPATISYGVDPLLGPLQDNGGAQHTHALLAGSPAIDAGNPALPSVAFGLCALADANGVSRPVDGDSNGSFICDLGAVEAPGDNPSFDSGDAPAPYPTLNIDNGARHLIDANLFLGAGVDADADGQPGIAADGDDLDGNDDEDGVMLPVSVNAGQALNVTVTSSAAGQLSVWMDLNRDGDWEDPGERLLTDAAVDPGSNMVPLGVPRDTAAGITMMRFRLAAVNIASSTAGVVGGEVEDYAIDVRRVADEGGSQDLIGARAEANAAFGRAIAILGNDLLVGSPEATRGGVPGVGTVWIFRRGADGWSGDGELVPADIDPAQPNNHFGTSLAITDGDQGVYLAIGADRGSDPGQANAGAVYIYRQDEFGSWQFQQKLNSPRSSTQSPQFGQRLALDFDTTTQVYTLAVAAPSQVDSAGPALGGAVFVYQLNPFLEFTLIDASCGSSTTPCGGFLFTPPEHMPQDFDKFGYGLALDSDRLLIGVPYVETLTDVYPGLAFLFERGGQQPDGAYNWTLRASLTDPNPQDGEEFGQSVAFTSTAAWVAAPYYDHGDGRTGVVYAFDRDASGNPLPRKSLTLAAGGAPRGNEPNPFGDGRIAGDGNVLGVPVSGQCNQLRLYQIDGYDDTLLDVIYRPEGAESSFASTADIDAESATVVVGSPSDTVQGQPGAGAAYVFSGLGQVFGDGFETATAGRAAQPKSIRGGACP